MKIIETNLRSIYKMISWRVLLTISHIITGFIVTGSWVMGLQIAGMAAIINSALYLGHERIWNKVPTGKKIIEQ